MPTPLLGQQDQQQQHPQDDGVRLASLGWQAKQQIVVVGDKVSSSSIAKVARCLLFLSAGEASERNIVVAGGVMCPLDTKASGGGIPAMGECPARAEADQASGGGTTKMTRG